MKQEAREANAELKQEAREAGNAAERAGDRVAQETKDATRSVGATLDAAAQTMQIKTALIDADNLDANNIDVDTNGATKTVTLKGHVRERRRRRPLPSASRRRKRPDYRVVNNLVSRSRSRGSRRVRGSRGAIPTYPTIPTIPRTYDVAGKICGATSYRYFLQTIHVCAPGVVLYVCLMPAEVRKSDVRLAPAMAPSSVPTPIQNSFS